ncbi:MAG TPA: FAD-binding protein [Candidatus Baltobacteraceae bacterium]|nr:FAD-binding protein [Candidatus Baltobacteraceae bacterium]
MPDTFNRGDLAAQLRAIVPGNRAVLTSEEDLIAYAIGGNVAENAGGARCLKYGVTGDYVTALQVVLADGTVLRTGGKTVKNVTGYDLRALFTGAEGTRVRRPRVSTQSIARPRRLRQ